MMAADSLHVAVHFIVPSGEVLRPLQRVERAVDLDRLQQARRVCELEALRQRVRIEHATPGRVAPAGNSHADACRAFVRRHCFVTRA